MLPPPTTIASSSPSEWTSTISVAIASTVFGSSSVLPPAHQRLAGELQQDAAEDGRSAGQPVLRPLARLEWP